MEKSIGILGAAGHIGSHLSNYLAFKNITLIDNFSTHKQLAITNTKHKIIDSSILENYLLPRVIVHLAAGASSMQNESSARSDLEFTKRIVDLMDESSVIIFASTASVYGGAIIGEMTEDDPLAILPQSKYAEYKYLSEEYIRKNCKGKHIIFRMGTIFGCSPGMRFHTFINKLCWTQSIKHKIDIWEDNLNTLRPYLSLEDCFQAFNMALLGKLPVNQTYNVFSEEKLLSEILSHPKIDQGLFNYIKSPLEHTLNYKVSREKIMKYGWVPQDTIEDGINDTLEYLGV